MLKILTLVLLATTITACHEDKSSKQSSSPVLEEFSSSIVGDYAVLESALISDQISTYPLLAMFPEIINLEEPDKLEAFINNSEAIGFDKEQFDIIYDAAFKMIEVLRIAFVLELTSGTYPAHENNKLFKKVTIDQQSIKGKSGRGNIFSYKINQNLALPNCKKGPDTCDINYDIDVSFDFPSKNPLFARAESSKEMFLVDMHIHINSFTISNKYASLDIGLNPLSALIISADHYFSESSRESEKLIPFETGVIIGNINDLYIYNTKDNGPLISSNIQGIFKNTFIGEDENINEIEITGSLLGTVDSGILEANYVESNFLNNPLKEGYFSGSLEATDLKVNFSTSIIK